MIHVTLTRKSTTLTRLACLAIEEKQQTKHRQVMLFLCTLPMSYSYYLCMT